MVRKNDLGCAMDTIACSVESGPVREDHRLFDQSCEEGVVVAVSRGKPRRYYKRSKFVPEYWSGG
jgi:hypothetical protein